MPTDKTLTKPQMILCFLHSVLETKISTVMAHGIMQVELKKTLVKEKKIDDSQKASEQTELEKE